MPAMCCLPARTRRRPRTQQQDPGLFFYGSDQQHAEQDPQQVAVTAAPDPGAQRAVSSVPADALGRYEALAADATGEPARGLLPGFCSPRPRRRRATSSRPPTR